MHVYLPAQRDAPTNMINNALSVASAHKLRFGQDLILYNLELSESIDGFDGQAHRQAWDKDPIWQGVRENVEGITGIRDWAEAFFVAAVIFEPLVGELFRSEFIMQVAAPQGDFVTPTMMGAGEADTARDARVAQALSGCWPTTPSTASTTAGRWTAGCGSGRRGASRPAVPRSRSGHSPARR
jgi:propane 2-monooxygenase small subunit